MKVVAKQPFFNDLSTESAILTGLLVDVIGRRRALTSTPETRKQPADEPQGLVLGSESVTLAARTQRTFGAGPVVVMGTPVMSTTTEVPSHHASLRDKAVGLVHLLARPRLAV